MGAEPQQVRIEELLQHAGWVRNLARTLVLDSGAAEDLIQETWLAALRRPPRDRHNLRGWLGRVVTNAARQRGRREAPRRTVAMSEANEPGSESPDALASAIETQRELAKHVLELDEPYRSTVIMRYWQDLDSAQIAQREGVPRGTVRWRLKQGLDRLRAKLDDSHAGDRRAWCTALLPLFERGTAAKAASTTLPALIHGVLGMNLTLKLALLSTIAVLALLGLDAAGILGFGPGAETRALTTAASDQDESEASSAVTPRATTAAAPERRAAMAPTVPEELAAQTVAVDSLARVTARAVDRDGKAVSHAILSSTYARGQQATADTDGRLLLALDPQSIERGMDFVVRADGHAAAHLEAVMRRGELLHLGEVVLGPGSDVAGRVVDLLGNPVEGASVVPDQARRPSGGLARARSAGSRSALRWMMESTDADGRFVLRGVPTGKWRICAEKDKYRASFSEPVEVSTAELALGVEIVLDPVPREDVIAGVVVGADGEPVPFASVTFERKSLFSSGSHSTTAGENGRFEEVCDPKSPRTIHAKDRNGRWSDVVVKGVRPGVADLVIRLGEALPVVFDVLDPDGERLADASIHLWDAGRDNHFRSSEGAEPDGSHRMTAPSQRFIAIVSAPGHEERELGPFDPLRLPQRIECTLAALPGVRGNVLAGGAPVLGARASVTGAARGYAEKNGFVVRVDSSPVAGADTNAQGRFEATVRKRGHYFVRVEAEDWAPYEQGPVAIDPSRGLDVGTIELTAGGAIEGRVLAPAGSDPAGTIVGISRGDGHPRTQRVGPDGAFRFERLIPGPWLVEIRDRELDPYGSSWMQDSKRAQATIPGNCKVFEGGSTRVDLSLGGQAPCVLEGTFQVDGKPAQGWIAKLHAADSRLVVDDDSGETLGADGTFRISRSEAGRYRLMLSAGADADIVAEIELVLGNTSWSAEIELATLDIEGLVPGQARTPAALYVWEQDGLLAVSPLYPQEDGSIRGLSLPAGPARIVHFEPWVPIEDPRDLSTWLELDLPAGETTRVRVP